MDVAPLPEKVEISNDDVLLSCDDEVASVLEDCLLLVDVWNVVEPVDGGVTMLSVLDDALRGVMPMLVPVPLSKVLTKTEVKKLLDSTGRADADELVVSAAGVVPPIGIIVFCRIVELVDEEAARAAEVT